MSTALDDVADGPLWNTRDGRKRAQLAGQGSVLSVAFSPDGKTVAGGGGDATVRLWDAGDGRARARLAGHDGSVFCVAFSPDGKTVASGAADSTLLLWNAGDGRARARLAGHGGRVFCVAFSPEGKTVAGGGGDATVRLWDVASGRCLAILYGTDAGTVVARPDGRYRIRGHVAGKFWHVIGLHRYEVGELDALVPGLRLGDDEPLYTRP